MAFQFNPFTGKLDIVVGGFTDGSLVFSAGGELIDNNSNLFWTNSTTTLNSTKIAVGQGTAGIGTHSIMNKNFNEFGLTFHGNNKLSLMRNTTSICSWGQSGATGFFSVSSSSVIGFGEVATLNGYNTGDVSFSRISTGILALGTGGWAETDGTLQVGKIQILIPATTTIGLTIKAAASQTASLLNLTDSSDNVVVSFGDGLDSSEIVFNEQQGDIDFRVEGDGDNDLLHIDASTDTIGVGIAAALGKLHIVQTSATGAKPVVILNQADVDEDYFKFIGTSDTSSDRALVDAANFTTPGTITGWLKINIQDDQSTDPITDGDYYIPFYTAPTA